MATLTTKFNVGDEVFILKAGAELEEADCGGIDLLESILSGIRKLRIKNIILDKDGVKYNISEDDLDLYQEFQLFASEKEVVFKIIADLKNHLETNLKQTNDLIKDLEKDYEGCREKISK